MNPLELIDLLNVAGAFPDTPGVAEVRQTHISVVFITPHRVYKVRKPVQLAFLDFRTIDRRKHDCYEEVRLNRRLAADVYRGVVPITHRNGKLRIGGAGTPVDWAVEMERLPDDAALSRQLERGELTAEQISRLAARIAEFHRSAERGERIAEMGRFAVVAGNAQDNFTEMAAQAGTTIAVSVFQRVRELTEQRLTALRSIIEVRALRGATCDTHGDLHLDHVYFFPDRFPPHDIVIIDCIEFNERFRYADPVADAAFLAMDLRFCGRDDLATAFMDAYLQAAADAEGKILTPFYVAYRALVRAKVEGIQRSEQETTSEEQSALLARARRHWLLALTALELPRLRPAIIMIGGPPGSGKSTLAQILAENRGSLIRSDMVRKALAGMPANARGADSLYTAAMNERTYAECLRRARSLIEDGKRAFVDANFARDADRIAFLQSAGELGVPAIWFECHAAPDAIRARLARRSSDPSDADWSVYERVFSAWEPPSAKTDAVHYVLESDADPATVAGHARAVLIQHGLYDEGST